MAGVDEKVKEIIVEQLGVEEGEVTPNASFVDDLGADPLDTVMTLEEAPSTSKSQMRKRRRFVP